MKQIVDKLNKIAKKIDESVEIPQTDLIIDSLDAITKAYGGTPNDSNLIVDKLEDIYNNIGSVPSGNIEITENGENINVAPYATATVNVAGGGGGSSPNILANQQSFHTELGQRGYEAELVWENNFDSTYYPTINVTFNGTTYNNVPLAVPNGYGEIGGQGPDFTNYPFFIYYPYIYTEQEETGTIIITGEEVLPTVEISFTNQVATPAGITFINGDGKLDYTEITSETKSIEVLNVEDAIIGITTGKFVVPASGTYITVTGNDITLYSVSKTTIYYYCHFNNAGSTPSITIRFDTDGGDN